MTRPVTRYATLLALLAALALPVAGCGKKGDPTPPAGETEFPRTYPAQ